MRKRVLIMHQALGEMPRLYFNATSTDKVGISTVPSFCRRKLMMQSGQRGESSLQAGILLYRSRLEIATRIKIKLSHWGALSTA